ncbi:hypothetical protein N825_01745 [Skermanella stibiiresistens SB22]|uniref:Response regulatory domain-containing protein n=1 Tax=Skermanella stibiiresistens SB22 TaxID=1385369 RepID=W9HG15_9PROT|nr:response regulator [Skermanella stibiiresistens]EWY42853.1 hypothetical protein N825_01745 [Skermanella stibiiresistens SB22]
MAQPIAATRPERLLVVEDDEFSQQLIELYLRKAGFTELTVANDGRQALDLAKANTFDLILLDLGLPRIGGTEVVRRLKKEGLLANTPVVVISAITNMEDTIQCIEMGASDYLAKPFNVMQLQQRVDACLERQRLRRESAATKRRDALDESAALGLRAALALPAFPRSGPGFPAEGAVLSEASRGGGQGRDFHDVFPVLGGGTGFVVGTVAGTGIAALLTVARVRALVRVLADRFDPSGGAPLDPAALITQIGAELASDPAEGSEDGRSIALFIGVLQAGGPLRHANAGMPTPVVLSQMLGVLPLAGKRGPPLTGDASFEGPVGGQVSLQPGDGLVVHTRGLVEATDAGGGAYGEQRLKVALDALIAAPAALISSTLREDAAGFAGGVPFKDDVTIVALRLVA